MHLSAVDLNLLVALDALLQTRSVQAAARRVGLTPSAMSHALDRLRALFDDPLLVRAGRGMVPTPRAEALAGPLRATLTDVEGLLLPAGAFDPARLSRTFRVRLPDSLTVVLLPRLEGLLAAEAPGVDLHLQPLDGETLVALRDGRTDAAVAILPDAPADVRGRPLLDERFVCVARVGHPAVHGALDLDTFCALTHVLVATRGSTVRGPVDDVLAELGRSRRVARLVPSFLPALVLASRTDHVLTIAKSVADALAGPLGLQVLEPPLPLPPYTLSLHWHARDDVDEAQAWFREAILRAAP